MQQQGTLGRVTVGVEKRILEGGKVSNFLAPGDKGVGGVRGHGKRQEGHLKVQGWVTHAALSCGHAKDQVFIRYGPPCPLMCASESPLRAGWDPSGQVPQAEH